MYINGSIRVRWLYSLSSATFIYTKYKEISVGSPFPMNWTFEKCCFCNVLCTYILHICANIRTQTHRLYKSQILATFARYKKAKRNHWEIKMIIIINVSPLCLYETLWYYLMYTQQIFFTISASYVTGPIPESTRQRHAPLYGRLVAEEHLPASHRDVHQVSTKILRKLFQWW